MRDKDEFLNSLQGRFTVSRETLDRLETYRSTLVKWQKRINLVSQTTLDEVWRRHFLDSAQVLDALDGHERTLLDIGTGAGFPGMVLAILGVPDVHLVESDQKKTAFLMEVARQTATHVTIHNTRIEDLPPFEADVVTARACASLSRLLEWAEPFLGKSSRAVFLKGKKVNEELTDARTKWNMQLELRPSLSDADGVIVKIGDLRRV